MIRRPAALALAVIRRPAALALAVIRRPAALALAVIRRPAALALAVIRRPAALALAVIRRPAALALAVIRRPAALALAVIRRPAALGLALALAVAAGLSFAGPSAARPARPPADPASTGGGAAAWVLRIEAPDGPVLRLADALARAGPAPGARAAPVVAAGVAPVVATAEPTRPEERRVATPLRWADPSGSLTVEGGVAEAQASARSASARTGVGTAGGTGFALADRLFTWEQQERLLAEVAALDAAVFGPLNARLAALTPVLTAAGLATPRFEALSPIGLVDVGRGSLATASAEVATSGDFAAGRAEASLDQVRLLGGFVDARRISAEAVAERSTAAADRRHGVWFGQLRIAGVDVVADGERIRVAGNDLASRAVVQPALDLLLAALRKDGVDLRVGEWRDLPDGPEVTALSLTITAPAGPIGISVATARAELPAAAPPAAPPAPVEAAPAAPAGEPGTAAPRSTPAKDETGRAAAPGGPPSDGGPSRVTVPAGGQGSAAVVSNEEAAPASGSGSGSGARPAPDRRAAPGRYRAVATARSLRAVYLLLVVAGFAGALALPALVVPVTGRPSPSRRRRLP